MGIPSGSGTEVLKRHTANLNNSTTTLTVPAHHIYTILSINLMANSTSKSDTDIYINNGSANIEITNGKGSSEIPGNNTFVYSDKIVMTAGDALSVIERDATPVSVWISYIDQDWS
jgi:hypothetical protein